MRDMEHVLTHTNFPGIKLFKKGKVRDIYDCGDKLIMVSTDRISAFDCVLSEGISLKGKVLNQLSAFWFEKTKNITSNHMISAYPEDFPSQLSPFNELIEGRAMLVRKTEPISIECVVRGYLSGSAYREYRERGSVANVSLPSGLRESDQLPSPLFTPATKSRKGHDVNISFAEMEEVIGRELSRTLRENSFKIYQYAADFLNRRGFILADTKFEFGLLDGDVLLIDEVITPDSSRFWLKETYTPGVHQESFDKQPVRDYLDGLNWNKLPPPPPLPPEIVKKTSQIYRKAYQMITGKSLFDP